MAERSSLGRLALSVGAAIVIPVALASAYSAWRARTMLWRAPEPADDPVAGAPAPAPPPAPKEPDWPREVDGIVFTHLHETMVPAGKSALEDVAPEAPYRVDLLPQGDVPLVSAARIDLDRDGRWDERWFARDGTVEREVSPGDDGRFGERYRWTGEAWEPVAPASPPGKSE